MKSLFFTYIHLLVIKLFLYHLFFNLIKIGFFYLYYGYYISSFMLFISLICFEKENSIKIEYYSLLFFIKNWNNQKACKKFYFNCSCKTMF